VQLKETKTAPGTTYGQ
jgi:protoheme IX farnesyltransferase